MLGGNTPITIWNRHGNRYHRTEIHTLVRCKQKTESFHSGAGAGMVANIVSSLVFRIPLLDNYLPPHEWNELKDKAGRFTIKAEDYIAIGIHGHEIGDVTVPELRRILGGQLVEIKAVNYNLHARLGKHIRAEGV